MSNQIYLPDPAGRNGVSLSEGACFGTTTTTTPTVEAPNLTSLTISPLTLDFTSQNAVSVTVSSTVTVSFSSSPVGPATGTTTTTPQHNHHTTTQAPGSSVPTTPSCPQQAKKKDGGNDAGGNDGDISAWTDGDISAQHHKAAPFAALTGKCFANKWEGSSKTVIRCNKACAGQWCTLHTNMAKKNTSSNEHETPSGLTAGDSRLTGCNSAPLLTSKSNWSQKRFDKYEDGRYTGVLKFAHPGSLPSKYQEGVSRPYRAALLRAVGFTEYSVEVIMANLPYEFDSNMDGVDLAKVPTKNTFII